MVGEVSATPNDPLSHSVQVQSAASAEGFDWEHVDGVLDKVAEELGEIRDALNADDRDHARRELGDLLLISVNLARFLGADPGAELRQATERFATRFSFLKSALSKDEKTIKSCAADELEVYWKRIKPDADKVLMKTLDMGPEDGANSSSVL
tara:strand:- start:58 stop:513 length:456 start_codon:yes stop_codon:yes gene_type:complete